MKYMVDIDEKSRKGKLAIGLLREMGFSPLKTPTPLEWGLPSGRKATQPEMYALLEDAERSEGLLLNDVIEEYKAKK